MVGNSRSHSISPTDSVTIVIKECIKLSTAMRKYSNFTSQSSVSALLSGSSELFYNKQEFLQSNKVNESEIDDNMSLFSAEAISLDGLVVKLRDTNLMNPNKNSAQHNTAHTNPIKQNDPLLAGLLQLRLMLNKLDSLNDIDSLTLIQPFLVVIATGKISTYITSLALDSLHKFLALDIINESMDNFIVNYREIVNAVINCKTDNQKISNTPSATASNVSNIDDTILIRILSILSIVINSQHFNSLSDSNVHEILTIIMSVACNKKKSEVLRKNAESIMSSITIKLFSKLNDMKSKTTGTVYINDESYSKDALKDVFENDTEGKDDVSETIHKNEEQVQEVTDDDRTMVSKNIESSSTTRNIEPNFGVPVLRLYLNMLLSLITPENQTRHTNSTKILALQFINMSVELSGDDILSHPQLFNVISDPIFKSILFIIQNSNKLSLLQAALQLFTTLFLNLHCHLQMQIELTLNKIFEVLLEGTNKTNKEVETDGPSKSRPPKVKELLIEQISILWTRSPSFFTSLFINFDCNLDRSDVAINFLKALTTLSLPESSITSTETVPPICLEGLVSFVDDLYTDLRNVNRQQFLLEKDTIDLIKKRERKTMFIKCAEEFNIKPKIGIPMLIEKGFIKSDQDSDLAEFLFENNSRVNKKQIGLLLCDPKRTGLLNEFIKLFNFENLRVDEAIRILLTKFRLPGESQQIERIVEAFSSGYVSSQKYDSTKLENPSENDNATVQPDSDSVFVLSYSIIMLNTDLHNPQVKEHMSFEDYSGNLKGCYNSQDFPHWYLDKIYCSIRDKEIVMPEEHHGDEKWFEDAWNNLISSTTVMTEIKTDFRTAIEKYGEIEMAHFNRAVFKNVGPSILSALFQIFVAASDEYITTRMLTTIEKCSSIASFFNFKGLFNDILRNISKITTLAIPENEILSPEMDTIPLVEIKAEDSNFVIPVSTRSVYFGKNYKGQLSTIVYFRIIRRNRLINMMNDITWKETIAMLLNMYENLLFPGDIFVEFQKKVHLTKLLAPEPVVKLNKNEESRGLFSTFASYLTGGEEPTAEEIDYSIRTMNCLQISKIKTSLFGNGTNLTTDVIDYFLDAIPEKKTRENARFYEAELLFITEISVALFSLGKNGEQFSDSLLHRLTDLRSRKDISKKTVCRLTQYVLILLSIMDNKTDYLVELLSKEIGGHPDVFDNDFFQSEEGLGFVHSLLNLVNISNYQEKLFGEETLWNILKLVTPIYRYGLITFDFLETSISNNPDISNTDNFFHMISLLDVISSIGAVGNAWEEEYENLVKSGHKVNSENPHKNEIELAIKSIDLCLKFIRDNSIFSKLDDTKRCTLIQVLCHQCQNPCKEIRTYTTKALETILCFNNEKAMNLPVSDIESLIEGGFMPLLENDQSHITDILGIVGKFYISYLENDKATNDTFIKILSIFNKFVEDTEVEKQLQQLIIDKKDIIKKLKNTSTMTTPSISPSPSPIPKESD
ncbi:hypothetical protein TPHA_0O00770 [Tetrapisispora phaffii CBS 4417]|uniref:SEC7 domain-containing protein n=1 Tax=Tetrapisispora phaffii (strain ATCC 24235 / CBS 4417 / NBRC 1672 / NRRL Y-8282 / UCD 70-5) TaxID=1071381 RepID=G8C1L8_TETPH|nr:hypothetical protein TPHA_0O00770 [Tetrapisispora phaffii CBS 4417]CCE66046.1 hypothetical protein TPHA_0O00770 [Tetrapisispora phaffii CBS 4417]